MLVLRSMVFSVVSNAVFPLERKFPSIRECQLLEGKRRECKYKENERKFNGESGNMREIHMITYLSNPFT